MVRVGVDVGGTFTDLVALAENGTIDVRKVVTTPADPTLGLFKALDALASRPIDVLIHGTTIATNALLERRGARVAAAPGGSVPPLEVMTRSIPMPRARTSRSSRPR